MNKLIATVVAAVAVVSMTCTPAAASEGQVSGLARDWEICKHLPKWFC